MLIFQIETFHKNVGKVGKRINRKFEVKLPTSRDFRSVWKSVYRLLVLGLIKVVNVQD